MKLNIPQQPSPFPKYNDWMSYNYYCRISKLKHHSKPLAEQKRGGIMCEVLLPMLKHSLKQEVYDTISKDA